MFDKKTRKLKIHPFKNAFSELQVLSLHISVQGSNFTSLNDLKYQSKNPDKKIRADRNSKSAKFSVRMSLHIFLSVSFQKILESGTKSSEKGSIVPSLFYVLFADPNPHICRLLQRELRDLPCRTDAVYTARDLADKIFSENRTDMLPDLLVLDPDMPDICKKDLLDFLCRKESFQLLVLHSIKTEQHLAPDHLCAKQIVFVEKNDTSPIRIRRIVESRTQKKTSL